MVVSRCLLRLNRLLLRLLGLDGRGDLCNPYKPFHALELLFAVQQHRPQPPLEHHAASCACDIPLTVPHQENMRSIGLVDISVLRNRAGTFSRCRVNNSWKASRSESAADSFLVHRCPSSSSSMGLASA